MNTDPNLRANPITQSVNELGAYISNNERHGRSDAEENDSDDEIRPFKGFAKPLSNYKLMDNKPIWPEKTNRLLQLISEHVDEALQTGFDDSIAKYKGKGHFVVRKLTTILFLFNEISIFQHFLKLSPGIRYQFYNKLNSILS